MPRACSVLSCGSNNARDKLFFYKFPSIFDNNGRVVPLAQERREKWIDSLRRIDLTDKKINYGYVCSKHFLRGKPSKLFDKDNIDWVPNQNMGYKSSNLATEAKSNRSHRIQNRNKLKVSQKIAMPSVCAVASCKSNGLILKKQGCKVIFHSFPKAIKNSISSSIRQEWIDRCDREDKFNPNTAKICSLHFTQNDYERDLQNELLGIPLRRILKQTAIPTLNLRNINSINLLNNSSEDTTPAKRPGNKDLVELSLKKTSGPDYSQILNVPISSEAEPRIVPAHTKISEKVMPCRCCVPGCKNNYDSTLKLKGTVPVFKFPKDSETQKLWLKSIERTNFFISKYSSICIDHFEDKYIIKEDEAMRPDGTVLIAPRTRFKLTPDAYPTKFGKTEDMSCRLETCDDFVTEEFEDSDPISIDMMETKPKTLNLSTENYITVMHEVKHESDMSLNHNQTALPRENSNDAIVQSEMSEITKMLDEANIESLCKICLKNNPDMWTIFSEITYDDGSTIDIVQAFQTVTRETDEQIASQDVPKQICSSCLELLTNAYNFHNKYQKSSEILKEWLQRRHLKIEEIEIVDEKNYDDSEIKPSFDKQIDDRSVEETSATDNAEESVRHSCPICSERFTAVELRRHCQSHKALRAYIKAAPKFNKKVKFFAPPRRSNISMLCSDRIIHPCPFCGDEFAKDEFKTHIQKHRDDGNFKCRICNRVFLGKNHLKMHELSHRREAPYKCKTCQKQFFKKDNYDYHKLKHTNADDLPFKCDHCEKSFSNPEHLKRHAFHHLNPVSYNFHYKRERYKCVNCLRLFQKEDEYLSHDCKITCLKCKITFLKRREFNRHGCRPTRNMNCQPCGVGFKLPSSYKMHKLRCTTKSLCYVCGKNVNNIYQHMGSHFPKSSVTCAICGKAYRSTTTLQRHIREVHNNSVKFYCQYCSKCFKSKWNCQSHEKIHSGQKDFDCKLCGKEFSLKSSLKKHILIHLQLKPNYSL